MNTWDYYDENSPKNETDGIYAVNSIGLNPQQILSRSQIESIIGTKYSFASYRLLPTTKYITADGILYAVTEDWVLIRKVEELGQIIAFSPDSTHLLYLGKNEKPYISNLDGSENKLLVDQRWSLGGETRYKAWSADGSTIYFERNFGEETWKVNSDGTDKRKLTLDGLKTYTPNEDTPLPEGVTSVSYYPKIDAMAVSVDKNHIAFTWANLLFVADPTDLEFSNPTLIIELPVAEYLKGGFVSAISLRWSPDTKFLIAQIHLSNFFGGESHYYAVLVSVDEKKIETVFPEPGSFPEYDYILPCGFSPDGQQIAFVYENFDAKKETLELTSLDGSTSTIIMEYEGRVGCPTWE